MVSKFKRIEQEIEEKESQRCAAHGCPLDGSISYGGAFYCFIHSGAEFNPAITTNIMERKDLILMARRGLNTSMYDWDNGKDRLVGYLTRHNREDLLPKEKELAYAWASRVMGVLKRECLTVKPMLAY